MNISPCEHKLGQMLQAVMIANLDARDFLCAVSGFGQFFIVSGVHKFV